MKIFYKGKQINGYRKKISIAPLTSPGYIPKLIAQYKFDKSICDNLIPEFNTEFTNYKIIDEYLDTDSVTTMNRMFYNCNQLTILNVSNWDTSNVTDMSYMFANCNKLTTLNVNNFDTSNVTNMFNMFGNCQSLTNIEGLESFNTSKVTNMGQLFMNCDKLTELDLSRFDVSKVTNIDYIFQFDNALTKLNLSNWHIQPDVRVEVPFMGTMVFTIFTNCYELTNIIMNNSDCDSINKIISVLPTRTADNIGALDIAGIDDINQVNIEAAQAKYWNIIED